MYVCLKGFKLVKILTRSFLPFPFFIVSQLIFALFILLKDLTGLKAYML